MRIHWPFVLTGFLIVIIVTIFSVGIVMAKNNKFATGNTVNNTTDDSAVTDLMNDTEKNNNLIPTDPIPTASHLKTPTEVRALYMSSWVASTPSMRDHIIELVDTTNINALVIDIKDATGKISFTVNDELIANIGSSQNLIKDISGLIETLHAKNIYVIGRISTFQDPYLTKLKPEWSLRSKKTGEPWKDRKGLSFLDPTKPEVWDYVTRLAQASYNVGFDEINFDYIRFPSDGNIDDILYPDASVSRSDLLERFFQHVDTHVRKQGIPTSADLFGLTTNTTDDMGIGQVLEKAMPYFDFIAPMIYPSHYPKNFQGYPNPATKPYEIVTFAMKQGVERASVVGFGPEKFRPWIQDFDLGADYTAAMVQDQIRALDELGISSYMVWDPSNKYTVGAYKKD
jgi:hypothetical protein